MAESMLHLLIFPFPLTRLSDSALSLHHNSKSVSLCQDNSSKLAKPAPIESFAFVQPFVVPFETIIRNRPWSCKEKDLVLLSSLSTDIKNNDPLMNLGGSGAAAVAAVLLNQQHQRNLESQKLLQQHLQHLQFETNV